MNKASISESRLLQSRERAGERTEEGGDRSTPRAGQEHMQVNRAHTPGLHVHVSGAEDAIGSTGQPQCI